MSYFPPHTNHESKDVTPQYLCSLMPRETEANEAATKRFYEKFKKEATEAARQGKDHLEFEVGAIELGLTDYEVPVVIESLKKLLSKEKFMLINTTPTSVDFAWKKKSSSAQQAVIDPSTLMGESYNYPSYANDIASKMREEDVEQWKQAMQYYSQFPGYGQFPPFAGYYPNYPGYGPNPEHKEEENKGETESKNNE